VTQYTRMYSRDLCELLNCVFHVWTYAGLPVYTINKDKQFTYVHCKTLFFSTFGIIMNMWCFFKFVKFENTFYYFTMFFQLISIYFQNIGVVYNSYTKKYEIASVINEILENRQLIYEITEKQITISKVHILFLKFIVVNVIIEIIVFVQDSMLMLQFTPGEFTYILCFYSGRFFNLSILLLYFLILLILTELYEQSVIINTTLKTYFQIYLSLRSLSLRVIKTFENFILFKIFTDFVLIATSLHYLFYIPVSYSPYFTLYMVFVLLWILTTLFFDFLMFYYFEKIQLQVK
jgi:hypothetical protein